jgi:adenosylmethionine-8-amino-7-oxononanoate aminotransferase
MSPPLVITHEEIDRLVSIIGAALDASAAQLAAL